MTFWQNRYYYKVIHERFNMKLGLGAFVAFCFLLMISSASALTYVDSCQTLDNATETYVMNASIVDNSGTCFTVSADNITLNCSGYEIDGQGTGTGVSIGADRFTIFDCTVKEFDDGLSTSTVVNYCSLDNMNVSYNADYGIYFSPDACIFCNITNSYINDNVDDGIYLRDSTNAYLYNLTVNRNDYGVYFRGSHNSIIDSSTIDSNKGRYGMYISSDNLTATNIHVTNTSFDPTSMGIYVYGSGMELVNSTLKDNSVYDISGLSLTTCPTMTLSNITVTGDKPLLFYKTTTVVQNTDNVGQLIFCEANDSVVNNVNMTANYIDIISSDNVTVSNFYCNGCGGGIDASNSNIIITDSMFNGTTYYPDINLADGANSTLINITSTNKLERPSFTFFESETISRNLNIDCTSCGYGAIEINEGNHTIYDSIIIGSHAGIVTDKANSAIVNIDVYDTNVSFVNNSLDPVYGSNNNSISIYCGYYNPPSFSCNETVTYNLYNTNFSSYFVNWTGSSLNRYWSLNVSNPLEANSTVYNATGDEVQNFDDSRSLWLKEYYVVANNVRTNTTPHEINWTRSGYEDNSTSVEMDSSQLLVLGMIQIFIPAGGLEQTLGEAGSGLGSFLTAITSPVVDFLLGLGIVGGILMILFGIASAIKTALRGVTVPIS